MHSRKFVGESEAVSDMTKINIGCGMTPTEGWLNLDNSLSLRIASRPLLVGAARALGLLNKGQSDYIDFCRSNRIRWADATRRIPAEEASAQVLYSSHMLEHLDRAEVQAFLKEARRVLAPGGIIRLVVPDIRKLCEAYREEGDADKFIAATHMCIPRPRGLAKRLHTLLVGTRHHQWMYDGRSLCELLAGAGFENPKSLSPGETRISDPGPLNLHERDSESAYVEAVRP